MIRNYLVIAFRNLVRQFSYSVINIVGLAIGLACSAVIFMYVFGEWSYDRHYPNADRTYRVGIGFFNLGGMAVGPEALGESLTTQYPGLEAFTRIGRDGSLAISTDSAEFRELAYYTDNSFFKIFPREFVYGNPATALVNDNSIVMTEATAEKIFGSADVLGKSVTVGKEKKPFMVTGIVKDDKRRSQLTANTWLSNHGNLTHKPGYTSASMYNYLMIKEGQTKEDLEAALDRILEKEAYPEHMGVPADLSFEDYKKHPNAVQFPVHALKDVHLKSTLRFEISPGGDERNMYAFGAISLFVLLLAAVNFVNLTTARAARRAREVGIRKAVGSSRSRLIGQFMMESLMVSAIAMLLAVFFGEGFLLIFQLITGSALILSLWTPWNVLILVAFTLIIGLCSGLYPAFYLTRFQPVRVLKGQVTPTGGSGFRNFLVVAQFTISICLMMCAAIIIHQMNFIKHHDLGFNQQHIVTIDNLLKLDTHAEAFEQYLSGLSGVDKVARHIGEPGNESSKTVFGFKSKTTPDVTTINTYPIDDNFVPLMGFQIIEGRNFNRRLASDTSAVILNEAAVKMLGLEQPVGTELEIGGTVVGVVKNYHWQSLREEIGPSAFAMGRNNYQELSLLLTNASANEVLLQAEKKWKELVPGEPFKYHFLDDNFGAILQQEQLFGKAVGFFTVLAIFVSCLGLYGLSAFTTEQRNKEIGIRKVMGASSAHIAVMLNKRFALLVAISVMISTPLAAFAMTRWLNGFAYRIDLQAEMFLSAIVVAFAVALVTVSYHSVRASLSNPVDALKCE